MKTKNYKFVIITGMSGAGKSLMVKCMEDIGYFCIDNIPSDLLSKFAELFLFSKGEINKIAIVVDARDPKLEKNIVKALASLKKKKFNPNVIFLDAKDDILIRRFSETRRPHPIVKDNVQKGIELERDMLKSIKSEADLIIDTSDFKIQDFKKYITNVLVTKKDFYKLKVDVIAFGFKNGLPLNLDLLFDVRFLPNPFYIDEFSLLSGNNEKVSEYVLQFDKTKIFQKKMYGLIDFVIPEYMNEGKTYLTIGIGCTGGQHRSVVIANQLVEHLKKMFLNMNFSVTYRDI